MHRIRAGVAVVLVAGFVAGACGGDDGNSSQAVDAGVKGAVEGQFGASSTTAAAKDPTTIEEWEQRWAEERAAIVERIKSEGWGKSADGRTVTGPEGFTVDLTACPSGWSDTDGVTDTTIKFGWPSPQSGPVADAGKLVQGADAILRAYSQKGAFKDSQGKTRSTQVVIRDDVYDPTRTVALVDELIDSEKVFGLSIIGQSNFLRVFDKLNQRCILNPFNGAGHPATGDVKGHPWSSNFLLLGSTEALIWGTYIEQHLDEWGGKAKVASLVATNDTGRSYDAGFKAFLAQSPRRADIEYVSETIEPGTPTIKDPMTTLAAQQPNVFIYMGPASVTCTQAIIEVAENGMRPGLKAAFQPGNCKASTYIGKERVGGDGSVSDGWMIMGGGWKDFGSAALDSDPWIAWARQQLTANGYDYKASATYGQGTQWGWLIAQTLQIAGQLEGGLTRTNFLVAMRAFDMSHPGFVPGIKINMEGGKDAYMIEGSDVSQFDATRQQWVIERTIDLSGTTPPCTWDAAAAVCR